MPMGNFYRDTSIVSYKMIEQLNISLIQFRDHKVNGVVIPAKAVGTLEGVELTALPVVLRVGAVDYRIGMIHRARKGRVEIFGDLVLEIEGALEFEPVKDAEDKISGIKPVKFVYQREKSG